MNLKKTYFRIKNSLQSEGCSKCENCLGLKMIELGLLPESTLELIQHHSGMNIMNFRNQDGSDEFSMAVRNEETTKIFEGNHKCFLKFESID